MSKKEAKIWEQLNKQFGGELLFRADEPMKFNWEVVDYPSISLGDAVGNWGLPVNGKMTQFIGAENSGKTMLSYLMIKATLDKYPDSEVLIIDTEMSANTKWMAQLGIDTSRVRIMPTNDAVVIWSALCGRVNKEGKKSQPGILDAVIAKEMNIKLIVMDSIADLRVPAEATRNIEDMEMAALARFLSRGLRMLKPMLVKANVGMLCINHLRDGMNGGLPSFPGGRALKHTVDFSILLHPSTGAENTLLNDKKEKIGHRILATVQKCRGGANKRQASFFLDFTKGVVKQGEEVAVVGASYGVIKRPNNRVWIYGVNEIVGKDNFFDFLDDNKAIRDEIIIKIKEAKESGAESIAVEEAEHGQIPAELLGDLDGPVIEDEVE